MKSTSPRSCLNKINSVFPLSDCERESNVAKGKIRIRFQSFSSLALGNDKGCFVLQRADEWEIVGNDSERIRWPKEQYNEMLMFSKRVTLRFSLTLKRRAGFQAYLLTLPCVVLGSLSVLVFSLPPERPDRHALGEEAVFLDLSD